MLKHVNCNICNSSERTVMYPGTIAKDEPVTVKEWTSTEPSYARYYDIVRCNSCGLVYMTPIDAGPNLYEDVRDEDYLKSWDERADTFRDLLKIVSAHKSGGQLLDIGSYGGIFLEVALKAGYMAQGAEVSKWGVEHARMRTGAPVHQGPCCTLELADRFDVITMWDVIEHLPDPSHCLANIHQHLKPNGVLALSTHNIESLLARMMGRRYPWLMRFHLHHFSPKTLALLLRKCGFEPILTRGFTKTFSLHYLLNRYMNTPESALTKKLKFPVPTGDMIVVLARKVQATD